MQKNSEPYSGDDDAQTGSSAVSFVLIVLWIKCFERGLTAHSPRPVHSAIPAERIADK